MISNENVMITEPRTWACLVCGKEYTYLKALKNHIKKYHPELHGVSRKELEERGLKIPMEPAALEEPTIPEKSIELAEEPEAQQEPTPTPGGLAVPTELQKEFPFAEKWADLSPGDKAKVQAAIDKVRPESHLTDILDFRIVDELVIMALVSGRKYKVDITQK